MTRLLLIAALTLSTAAAAKDECKEQCSAVRAACAGACENPDARKPPNKKQIAECVKKMCDMAVQQCESACGGSSGKKR